MFKKILKFSNFFVLGLSIIVFYFVFDSKKLSTNVLDLFPQVEQRELLDIHMDLEDSNQILIYTKDSIKPLESLPYINYIAPIKDNIYMMDIDKNVNMEDFYADFKEKIPEFSDLKYFSPKILSIENTNAIFTDVNIIMASSVSFLIILYLFILRIPFLSLNTLITIVSANLLGISVITAFYDNVNVMALNFGVAIGNLAIDYMLHHHFFRLYMHHFKFNKSVFYGFITSFIGFAICLFVPFPLLSQLSVYAMVCLFVSYVSFAFLYQAIGFKKPVFYRSLRRIRKPKIKNKMILILSILILAVTLPNLKLDYNLERLDYENKPRLADRDFFLEHLGQDSTILITGDSKEDIYAKVNQIAQNATLKSDPRNMNIIEENNKFYAKLNVDSSSLESLKKFDFVDTRSIKELSDEITMGIYKPMILVLSGVIIVMVIIVFIVTRSLVSFSYTIAPLSVISLFFFTTQINIMHLFSLLIVVVSSVDYGIYIEKEGENIRTLHAIIFSALTTLAGFGFLSFSNILALKSFGMTISIGLFVILLLLLFQKRHIKQPKQGENLATNN
ncbi:hypothetical protein CCY99_03915 [Helicobacter sp. 16-1353]|uniref:hypothetical protein n=1 Tax=Helicobacter sp. 16-1353 TaxID=2004996 RepID=UPI000DCC8363|nr:hypothetical protein [Helicobacter sp. 16-1353]RAX54503.1 hypothetical protein CCY99_03915 [Helicobacter sp. 16-1353]